MKFWNQIQSFARKYDTIIWIVICVYFMTTAYGKGLRIGREQGRFADTVYVGPVPDTLPAKWERLYILKDSTREYPIYIGIMNPSSDTDYTPFFDAFNALPGQYSYDWVDRKVGDSIFVNYMSNLAYQLDITFVPVTLIDPMDGTKFSISLDTEDGNEPNCFECMDAFKRMLYALKLAHYKKVE